MSDQASAANKGHAGVPPTNSSSTHSILDGRTHNVPSLPFGRARQQPQKPTTPFSFSSPLASHFSGSSFASDLWTSPTISTSSAPLTSLAPQLHHHRLPRRTGSGTESKDTTSQKKMMLLLTSRPAQTLGTSSDISSRRRAWTTPDGAEDGRIVMSGSDAMTDRGNAQMWKRREKE
jgi:hypothetical protein